MFCVRGTFSILSIAKLGPIMHSTFRALGFSCGKTAKRKHQALLGIVHLGAVQRRLSVAVVRFCFLLL